MEKQKTELPPQLVYPVPSLIITPPLIQQPEESVTQDSTVPVRRKVSRFEVVTLPNIVASTLPNTETPQSTEHLPSPVPCPLPTDDAMTRITIEPDEKDVVNFPVFNLISYCFKIIFLLINRLIFLHFLIGSHRKLLCHFKNR